MFRMTNFHKGGWGYAYDGCHIDKWLQEISTGVYVGNINARIREELWKRIIDNIKQGQATMSYAKRNEIGYDFMVHNTKREVIYCDGIPLVFLPKELSS